jgi:thiamine-phosphate pyrophosphorylase
MDAGLPPLYAIVDQEVARQANLDPVRLAEAYFRGGVRWLQYRAKQAAGAELLASASAIAALARECGAAFVVNDRADIARLVNAGVHVGQEDLPPRAVRAVLGESAMVGLSTHNILQVEAALHEPISYLAVGPVFATATKETGYDAVGLELVRLARARAGRDLPIVGIGGITRARARSVLDAGATAVAVIADLVGADPEARARAFLAALA